MRALLLAVSLAAFTAPLPGQVWDVHEVFIEEARDGRPPQVDDLSALRVYAVGRRPADMNPTDGVPTILERVEIEPLRHPDGTRYSISTRIRMSNFTSSSTATLHEGRPHIVVPRWRLWRSVRGRGRGYHFLLVLPVEAPDRPVRRLPSGEIVEHLVAAAVGGGKATRPAMGLLAALPLSRFVDAARLDELVRTAGQLETEAQHMMMPQLTELQDRIRLLGGDREVLYEWLEEVEGGSRPGRIGGWVGRARLTTLQAAWSVADEPHLRGLIGWLIVSGSDPDAEFIETLAEEVEAGDSILPGEPERQRDRERQLEAMVSRRDIGTASLALLAGAASMAAMIFLLRRVARRAIA